MVFLHAALLSVGLALTVVDAASLPKLDSEPPAGITFNPDGTFYGNLKALYEANLTNSSPEDLPHGHTGKHIKRQAVTGSDGRYKYESLAYPWRAVGRINSTTWTTPSLVTNGVCSGALVGPSLVLTARHCIDPDPSTTYYFMPAYDWGPNTRLPAGMNSVKVTQIIPSQQPADGDCHIQEDFALFVLEKPIGNTLGYFGAAAPTRDLLDKSQLTTLGYPCDREYCQSPMRQDKINLPSNNPNCHQFTCSSGGPIESDNADVGGGQSGSPLWVPSALPNIVGVTQGAGGGSSNGGPTVWTSIFYASGKGVQGFVQYARGGGGYGAYKGTMG